MPTINIDSKPNSTLTSVTVSEMDGSFLLEINCGDPESAKDLQGTIGALKKIFEADSSSQNFILEKYSSNAFIRVTGNIFNALNILKEKDAIDKSIFWILDANKECQTIIQSSKTFGLTNNNSIQLDTPYRTLTR